MKTFKFTLITFMLVMGLSIVNAQNQGVAINTDGAQADVSAMLDVKSTTGGVLVPRMLESDRNGISSPATGLLVYQTNNTPGFYYYNGSAWLRLEVEGAMDSDWTVSGNNMYNNNSGNVGIGTNSPAAKLDISGHVYQTDMGGSTFFGAYAGTNDDLVLNNNTFIGFNTGNSNTSGNENVAVGYSALSGNTTGQQNVVIGPYSLWTNQTGSFNTALGFNTLFFYAQLGGLGSPSERNTAIGYEAMKGSVVGFSAPSGERNTAVGYSALFNINSGDQNTSVGYSSMIENTTGGYNTALGYAALDDNVSGNYNTAVGYDAGPTATGLTNTGAFGFGALPTSSNQIVLGNSSVTQVKTAGGITVGNTSVTEAGTIRFDGTNFWGYNGTSWVQLDN